MGQDDKRPDLQSQIDTLIEGARVSRGDISDLQDRSSRSQSRADKSESRADMMQEQVDHNHKRLADVIAAEQLDREMIAELQAEGVVSQQHGDQLKEALRTSRTIGAAVGIIVGSRQIDEGSAFTVLSTVSRHSSRKVRDIAAEIVSANADLSR